MADLKPRGVLVEEPAEAPGKPLVPRGVPVDSAPVPEAKAEEVPTTPTTSSGPKGYLDDPKLDAEAYEEGTRLAKMQHSGAGELFISKWSYGADRVGRGIGAMLQDKPYAYGKAVDKYMDDIAAENSGGLGKAAEIAGTLLSPGIGGKARILKLAAQGAIGSALQGQNESVEGDHRDALIDNLTDAGIGGIIGGALGALGKGIGTFFGRRGDISKEGRGKTVTEAVERAKTNLGVKSTPEAAANEFSPALTKERDSLYEAGRQKMASGTEGDFVANDDAAGRLQYFSRTEYPTVRAKAGKQAIPISEAGTPSAYKFQTLIDSVGDARKDTLTLKDLDDLRIQGRGLRSAAVNATDKSAVDDLNATLDGFIDKSIDEGKFVGTPDFVKMYRDGRSMIGQALKLEDSAGLKNVLNDRTIPGSAIADEIMTLSGNKNQRKSVSKAVDLISEALGDNSESMDKIRAGILSTLLKDDDPAKVFSNLNNFLPNNQELMGKIFTPEQMGELAKLTAALQNVSVPASSKVTGIAKDTSKSLVDKTANFFVKQMMSPRGVASAMTGGLASPAAGAGVFAGITALKLMSSKPVRAVADKATQLVGEVAANPNVNNLAAREGAANPELRQSARQAIIDQLGGAQ